MAINVNDLQSILDLAVEGANGDHVFDNEKAEIGYLPESEKLRIIERIPLNQPPAIDLVALGAQNSLAPYLGQGNAQFKVNNPYVHPNAFNGLVNLKLIVLNADPLLTAVPPLSVERACYIGMLRARWLWLGCLFTALADRCVTHDEVVVVPMTNDVAAAADLTALIALGNVNKNIVLTYLGTAPGRAAMAFVINHAELIWAMSEHIFRVRGHHFKPEFETMIKKAFKSSSPGNVDFPAGVSLVDTFRTAIHPFGIRALPCMTVKFAAWGKVGNGMLKRFDGASNGFAAVTTAFAAGSMIASEPWYSRYAEKAADQIDAVGVFAKEMLKSRYQFHISAALYGVVPIREVKIGSETYTMNDIDLAVTAVAPVLQAFINWSNTRAKQDGTMVFSFANAKVLEKRASANPLMVARMVALLNSTINMIEDAESTQAAICEAFPKLN